MMLGRKQSLKGEPVLADYGPDENFNESADIEWVNKVKCCVKKKLNALLFFFVLPEMGSKNYEIVCSY